MALIAGTLATAAPAEPPVRQQLQDLVERFSRGLSLSAKTRFADVHRYTDSGKATNETWLCGRLDVYGDGNWRRFYVPPRGELTIRPHENLGSLDDVAVRDCQSTVAQFKAGHATRQAAARACQVSSLLAEARAEQTDFDLRYITWCRLGAAAREIP